MTYADRVDAATATPEAPRRRIAVGAMPTPGELNLRTRLMIQATGFGP